MEIKHRLTKPYTEEERMEFIVQYNHQQGLLINETEDELQALGNTEEEELALIKESKLQQALDKANDFINNTATYRDIECTDNNIGKLSAYYMALSAGVWETADWTTKNDNKIQLTAEDVQDILLGIANVQSDVWTRQYLEYVEMINNAKTVEELEKIEIEYAIISKED